MYGVGVNTVQNTILILLNTTSESCVLTVRVRPELT